MTNTLLRITLSCIAFAWLVVCGSGCNGGKDVDGGADEADWTESAEVGEVLGSTGTGLLMVGAETGVAYMMRRSGAEEHVLVVRVEDYPGLLAIELGGERGGGASLDVVGCVYRDGDGVPAGEVPATGSVALSGMISARNERWKASFSGAALSLEDALVAQDEIDATDLEAWVGLEPLAHIEVDVACMLNDGDHEYSASMDAVAVPGTKDEVDSWWDALSSLIPDA
ncbi:MAG: hypothetical protein PHU25_08345 [Deltaproteobacteria bacterium]|nr:hypothetical protein [Deltaproteobacteria bacterium]